MDLIFTRTTLLGLDGDGSVAEGCDLVVSGRSIAALGPGAAAGRDGRVIDGTDLVIMPGFVNGHTHSPENLAKGRDERSTLEPWLAAIWPRLDSLTPRQIYVAALLGAIEMIRTGTVAVVDHFRQTPVRADAIDAVCRAYADAGLRALVAVMLRDRPGSVQLAVTSAEEQLAVVKEAADLHHRLGHRVRIGLGPSAPTRCTDELWRGVVRLAKNGLLLHTHVDETRDEAAAARALYGRPAVQHLAALGAITPALTLAHGVWIDDADIDALATGGAAIVHNPISNMRLGSGIAPIAGLRRRGVPVVLGSDGAASNDGQSMPEVVKAALLVQRVAGVAADEWLSAREALAMATTVPARVFGFGAGDLAVGGPADFIALRRSGYALTPANDLHRQIAFCAAGVETRYAVVDGRVLLEEGRLTTINETAVLKEAQEIAGTLFADGRPA
jgi:cytosine/adenosine deaminase-related metal-dependent hydrolase